MRVRNEARNSGIAECVRKVSISFLLRNVFIQNRGDSNKENLKNRKYINFGQVVNLTIFFFKK